MVGASKWAFVGLRFGHGPLVPVARRPAWGQGFSERPRRRKRTSEEEEKRRRVKKEKKGHVGREWGGAL